MEREAGIIERGKVIAVEGTGYRIASADRDGIETPPLQALPLCAEVSCTQSDTCHCSRITYRVGDKVYYFMFKDGTGLIICKIY